MEKIKGNITKHLIADFGAFQLYREDFERAIDQACQELQIEDLKSEGQRPWKAVCKRVGEIIFNDNSILKDKQLYDNTCMLTNYNRYNYNILNSICDEYIYISDVYNKLCSTVAFSNWCNIDCGVIDNWRLNKESRCYPDTFTDDDITADLKQFENVIINLAVYDHSQAGENYMSALSEGGVSRTWKDRDKLFVGVFPFVKVL